MADAVYQALDRMLPALEDLQIRGLFTPEEVRAIASKRRDFEFLLRRRTARKNDFLRYITHELNLEELRHLRKHKAGLVKTSLSDHAGRGLIHFIFERALRKFRGDLELWLQYLDYCESTGSHKAHSRALAQALQLFPRTAGLWIRAASYEFFERASPPAARVLMQRGLRLNASDSALLWTQYFKLEVLYVMKLKGRRTALGLEGEEREGKGEEGEEKESVQLPLVEGEEGGVEGIKEVQTEEDLRDRSVRAVLAGAVPRVVYLAAIEARPRDLDMRLSFLKALEEAETLEGGVAGAESGQTWGPLVEEVLQGVEEAFGAADAAWARARHVLAGVGGLREVDEMTRKRRKDAGKEGARSSALGGSARKRGRRSSLSLPSGGESEAVEAWKESLRDGPQRCLQALETGLGRVAGIKEGKEAEKMWHYYLRGLCEFLHAPVSVLRVAFPQAQAALSANQGTSLLAPAMYLRWAALWVPATVLSSQTEGEGQGEGYKEEGERTDVGEARRILARGVEGHQDNARLWEARLRAEAWGQGGRVEEVFGMAQQALGPTAGIDSREEEEVGGGERRRCAVAGCWYVYLEWLMQQGVTKREKEGEGGDTDSSSDEEDEDEEEGGAAMEANSRKVENVLEQALISTRGLGRVAICELWHRYTGLTGLQRALSAMGEGGIEEQEAMAALCQRAMRGDCSGLTVAWFEAALAFCGRVRAQQAAALWDEYEAFERAQGRHRAANNVRWRRAKAMGEE